MSAPVLARVEAVLTGRAVDYTRPGSRSAIAKQPVPGPVAVGTEGLHGDEQGDRRVHGGPDKAIHHYPREHYAAWRGEIGAHPLLDGLQPGDHAYFVHSYALRGADPDDVLATTDYGGPVVALVARGNRAGTQFHVEKSQDVGLRILANFLRWTPQS